MRHIGKKESTYRVTAPFTRNTIERSIMDDNKIIELLFNRAENALDEITLKYAPLYKDIIRRTLRNESDIEECANDLLLAVWNSIPPNKPNSLAAYICKLSRRIGVDKLRYNTRQKRNSDYTVMLSELNDCLPQETRTAPEFDQNEKLKTVLTDFVRQLDPETRILFVRRYIYLESVTDLATRFEISENHISAKLYRARKKLKKSLEKEGLNV